MNCFVIMPFSATKGEHTEKYWNDHFNDFLKPTIESYELCPLTAFRSAPLRGDIVRQIITDLVTSPIVVADLTDANPNVYWELGVRQSFKNCTITIAEYGTPIPFDIGAKGTLFYHPHDHIKTSQFREDIIEAIKDCVENPSYPDSHVLEAISGRGSLFQILMKEEALRKLDALLSEIKFNQYVMRGVKTVCQQNNELIKDKKITEIQVIVMRLRTSSITSMVANRYLDAGDEFYSYAENYFNSLIGLNENLNSWDNPTIPKGQVEKRLLSFIDNVIEYISSFQKRVTEQKKKLSLLL